MKHRGHCFRNTRSANIQGAKTLTETEIKEGLAYAKAKGKQLKKEVPALRKLQMKTDHMKPLSNRMRFKPRKFSGR